MLCQVIKENNFPSLLKGYLVMWFWIRDLSTRALSAILVCRHISILSDSHCSMLVSEPQSTETRCKKKRLLNNTQLCKLRHYSFYLWLSHNAWKYSVLLPICDSIFVDLQIFLWTSSYVQKICLWTFLTYSHIIHIFCEYVKNKNNGLSNFFAKSHFWGKNKNPPFSLQNMF